MSYANITRNRSACSQLHQTARLRTYRYGFALPSRLLVRFLLLAGMLCLLLLAALTDGKSASAAALPTGNDPVKVAVGLARPAVVRIYTTVSGRLLVHFPSGDVLFPRTGERYTLTISGSGTFISAHGDILTADHVVHPPSQVLADVAAADATAYINQHHLAGTQLTVDQVYQALQDGQLATDVQYDAISSQVYLSTDYTGPLSASTLQEVSPMIHQSVDRIETESAFDQRDLAIVHAPFTDTASVSLGDSSMIQVQDELTIIGFPGNGDVSTSPTNLLTSSVNTVTVSALKTTNSGASVIQVGGNVEHGDSGGPALDSTGAVVGIVSFGLSDGSPGATSFLQASTSAQALIEALHLDTTPGMFQQKWHQALTDYWTTTPGHWHKAAQELAGLAAAYPLFQAVTPYLTHAQSQARTEQVLPAASTHTNGSSPSPSSWIVLPMVAWTAGTLVLLLLVGILLRRSFNIGGKKQKPAFALVSSRARQAPTSPLPQIGSAGGVLQPIPTRSKEGIMAHCVMPGQVPQSLSVQMSTMQAVRQAPLLPPLADAFQLWRCEHINRPQARFCRVCGEPAQPPTLAWMKQEVKETADQSQQ